MEFTVPDSTDSVALYVVVGEGAENLTIYLDHIVLSWNSVTENSTIGTSQCHP